MDVYWIDGRFSDEAGALISVNDLAVLRGCGVFDFLRTYGKKPFFLEDHVRRLRRSARLIDLAMPLPDSEIMDVVGQVLARSDHTEVNVRMVVTGGVSPDAVTPQGNSSLIVMATKLKKMPEAWYAEGAKTITAHVERYCPAAKTINYIPAIQALRSAARRQAVEALYVDRYSRVLEGTTSNFFGFMDNRLITPGRDVLSGVTRNVILRLARDMFDIDIRDIGTDELRLLDEAFITASNKEVVPVTAIDEITVGEGRVGPNTRRIMDAFKAFTRRYAESEDK